MTDISLDFKISIEDEFKSFEPQPLDVADIYEIQQRHPGHRVFVESHDPTTAMIAVPLFYLEELERNQVEQTPDDTLFNLHLF